MSTMTITVFLATRVVFEVLVVFLIGVEDILILVRRVEVIVIIIILIAIVVMKEDDITTITIIIINEDIIHHPLLKWKMVKKYLPSNN